MLLINGNNVLVSDSAEELARAAALRFVSAAQDAIPIRGRFAVSLAGGQTPRRVYQILGTEFTGLIDWASVHLFFGDERCVPPDDPDSNYLMVYTALISRVAISPDNVHRMIGEGDPAANASAYEQELKEFFGNVQWPQFDLVFLGLGTDGHTASLFPNSSVLSETSRWVLTAKPVGASPNRITLTLPVLNSAAQLVFLVSGEEKAETLSRVLRPASGPLPSLPAQLVKPTNGSLVWLVDRNAASRL
jgi:6-phosphogluconolactonase